jgi:hypothetical protein
VICPCRLTIACSEVTHEPESNLPLQEVVRFLLLHSKLGFTQLNLRTTSGTERILPILKFLKNGYEYDREVDGSISAGSKARN